MGNAKGMNHFRQSTFETVASVETKRGTPVMDSYTIRTLLDLTTFKSPLGSITQEHLAAAKSVLDHFVVLILEEPDSMPLLKECYLDWSLEDANTDKVVNKAPDHVKSRIAKQIESDKEWSAELEKLNRFELELYEYALELSHKQVEACRLQRKGKQTQSS